MHDSSGPATIIYNEQGHVHDYNLAAVSDNGSDAGRSSSSINNSSASSTTTKHSTSTPSSSQTQDEKISQVPKTDDVRSVVSSHSDADNSKKTKRGDKDTRRSITETSSKSEKTKTKSVKGISLYHWRRTADELDIYLQHLL